MQKKALDDVKNGLAASDSYYYRAKQAVYRADDYVHETRKELVWVRLLGWFWDCCGTPLKPSYTGVLHFFVVPRIM